MGLAYAMGMGSQGAGGGGQGSSMYTFLPLILLFAVFYFLLIKPQQKKAKQHKTFMESLKKGDSVITSGGLYGKITGITDEAITLEIAEKVRVKVSRSAVVDYVKGEQA
jgi:preprotein translocase subunit YajC